MNAHLPPLPAVLPSRQAVFEQAVDTLRGKGPVFITGAAGSGKTTLGQMLLAARAHDGQFVHRLSGSSALRSTPFATLAAISAQVPGLIAPGLTPIEAITTLAHKGLSIPRTFLIDHASHVDEESAAAIAQVWPTIELVIATPSIAELPTEFQQLAFQREARHVHLDPITIEDAQVLLDDLLDEICNSSTVNRLFNLSGGNPMYLREVALQAEQQGALTSLNGYRTLAHGWNPTGGRISDLVAFRLRDQPQLLRDAVNIIALTGPLPTTLASRLIAPEVLEQGAREGLLVVSHRHHLTDIAQSFDGPGAEVPLHHPREMVQLGSGLSFDLVLASLDTPTLRAHLADIHAHLDEATLPAGTRMHLAATLTRLGRDTERASADTDRPLAGLAQRITRYLREGKPLDGVQVFADHINTPLWIAGSSHDQTVLIQCMYLAMIGEGSRPDAFDEHFTSIDWHDVSLDHAVFLTGRGDLFLELGNAAQAEELFAQALGVSATHDATGIAGFTAGLAAVAGVMLGDHVSAKGHIDNYREAPADSGGFARPEAERLTLLVTLELEGRGRARKQYLELLTKAEHEGHPFLAMRLMHDAWRLRLIDDHEHFAHLDRLATVASQVQGSFAALLSQYAPAFRALIEPEAGGSTPTVESIAMQHLAAGRALFAAEVAARAAEITSAAGDRRRTATLLTLFAQATPHLPGVNTPSLGRARIDPAVLSEREVEVCEAAEQGLTNPEIASQLFLSPRTVEGHLQRAYAKLGITDRRQLLPLSLSATVAR